jgi:hypothetical protein
MIVTGIIITTAIGTVNEAIGVTTSAIMSSYESAHSRLKQGAESRFAAPSDPAS